VYPEQDKIIQLKFSANPGAICNIFFHPFQILFPDSSDNCSKVTRPPRHFFDGEAKVTNLYDVDTRGCAGCCWCGYDKAYIYSDVYLDLNTKKLDKADNIALSGKNRAKTFPVDPDTCNLTGTL
jgi:hypothetical protein